MDNKEEIVIWLNDNLSSVLEFPVPSDLVEYIIAIEHEQDIEDYIKTLLDLSNPSHRQFLNNYKLIRHIKADRPNADAESSPTDRKKSGKAKNKKNERDVQTLFEDLSIVEEPKDTSPGKKGKKNKYVNLYSAEGANKDVILLKGRHKCDCQASKHKLVNNCLTCGRIVCAQEGSGPCTCCGSLVCSKEEQEFLKTKSSQSQKLYDNLMEAERPVGWEEAISHRDRLLEYDRTTQRRTKVIDDEGEYYSASSVWLSPKEREKMSKHEEEQRKKKHASRSEVKFTLDFAGRQVVEDEQCLQELQDEDWMDAKLEATSIVNPEIHERSQPTFVETPQNNRITKEANGMTNSKNWRVQDKGLLEMSDIGVCLSMHQPWASLLVHGIKCHEGRSWYSSHRGRLWIAAASKSPSDDEIRETEQFYRLLKGSKDLKFPKNYPTSCLLGCVTVTDVLSQEEYQSRYTAEESQSPFVFICEDARALSLKFPMVGQHKIYKLDSKIHIAAQKSLLRSERSDG